MRRFASACALLLAIAAAAEAAPEGERLAHIDANLSSSTQARVATLRGIAIVTKAHAAGDGVRYRFVVESKMSDTLRVPGVIAWDEIVRVETQGDMNRNWITKKHLALGLASMGLVYALVSGSDGHEKFNRALVHAPLWSGAGFAAGYIYERRGARWHTIYP